MCSECRSNPCKPQCPNANPEPFIFANCQICGEPIFDGENAYSVYEDEYICEDCINDAKFKVTVVR